MFIDKKIACQHGRIFLRAVRKGDEMPIYIHNLALDYGHYINRIANKSLVTNFSSLNLCLSSLQHNVYKLLYTRIRIKQSVDSIQQWKFTYTRLFFH